MNTLKEELQDYIRNSNNRISSSFAIFLEHNFGNIKTDGYIKQFLFVEGDTLEYVLNFLKENYREYVEDI